MCLFFTGRCTLHVPDDLDNGLKCIQITSENCFPCCVQNLERKGNCINTSLEAFTLFSGQVALNAAAAILMPPLFRHSNYTLAFYGCFLGDFSK